MTHTRAYRESEGVLSKAVPTTATCRNPNCRSRTAVVQTWDSHCGSWTDYKYTCGTCDTVWWVDGPDS